MTDEVTIRVEGVKEIQAAFDRVSDQFSTRQVKRVLSRAATPASRTIKSEAPVGPTGNLRRAVRKKSLRGDPPAVSVRPSFKIAPHAHLVIHGTGERFRRRGRVTAGSLQLSIRGGSTGSMPANDFVKRGFERSKGQSSKIMFDGFKALLAGVGR